MIEYDHNVNSHATYQYSLQPIFSASSIELKHLCLEYMTPWLLNMTRFCGRHPDDARQYGPVSIH